MVEVCRAVTKLSFSKMPRFLEMVLILRLSPVAIVVTDNSPLSRRSRRISILVFPDTLLNNLCRISIMIISTFHEIWNFSYAVLSISSTQKSVKLLSDCAQIYYFVHIQCSKIILGRDGRYCIFLLGTFLTALLNQYRILS